MREFMARQVLRCLRRVTISDRGLWRLSRMGLAGRTDLEEVLPHVTDEGFKLQLELKNYLDSTVYFGVFELLTVRHIKRLLRPGDFAVDVGANIGYMTSTMARAVGASGRVVAFEPMSANYRRLTYAVEANGFTDHATLFNCAVGDAEGEVTIYLNGDGNDGTMASMNNLNRGGTAETVPVSRLDDAVAGDPRLIKVDVEGAEVGVVRGAQELIRRARPHWIIEYNPGALRAFGHGLSDIYEALTASGVEYDLIPIGSGNRKPINVAQVPSDGPGENFWCRPK